jgi:hypothetical protein
MSAGAHVAVGPARVLVGASLDPPRQARWSVLARPLLVVPLAVVVVGLQFASFFVVVAAWFAALFVGRVPDGLQRFLTNALRVYVNVLFYGMFLVPRWPGVVFHSRPDEQVSVTVDHVGLRRSAVFFRFVLGYPASLLSSLLAFGLSPLWFVMWIWGVLAGREARALHQGAALVARFQARVIAYSEIVTPTQPFRGFLGDGDQSGAAARAGGGGPAGAGAEGSSPSSPARVSTAWLVGRPAKVVVVLVLLVGAPSYLVLNNVDSGWVRTVVARPLVSHTHTAVLADVRAFLAARATCAVADRRRCTADAAATADSRLRDESALLVGNALIPSGALAAARRYEKALTHLDDVLRTIEFAPDASSQRRDIEFSLPTARSRFNDDYESLWSRLTW